jgi:hypothetical protein
MTRSTAALAVSLLAGSLSVAVAAQTPVPRPFPGSGAPPSSSKPQPPPAAPPAAQSPTGQPTAPPAGPAQTSAGAPPAGLPVFPQAEFLTSFDAGRGQRYYLYGTGTPFEQVVDHYRTTLRTGGRELYRAPAIRQFDLGRFDDDAMAFPPSVVVKDYAAAPGGGYLFVRGAAEQRFRTIIQIVPPAAGN